MLTRGNDEPIAMRLLRVVPLRRGPQNWNDDPQFTVPEIERLLRIAARIVESRGERYLGLFEMIEKELAMAKRRESSLNRALTLAKSVQQTDNIPCN